MQPCEDPLLATAHRTYSDFDEYISHLRRERHAKRHHGRRLIAGLIVSMIVFKVLHHSLRTTPTLGPAAGSIKYIVPFGDSYTDISGVGDSGTAWPVYAASRLTPRTAYNFPYLVQDELPNYFNSVKKGLHLPPKETMYSLWIGTNDIGVDTMLTGQQTSGTTIVSVTRCAVDWIKILYEWGARNFLFQNMIPLNLTTIYRADGYLTHFWTEPHNQTDWSIYMTEVVSGGNEIARLLLQSLPANLPGAHIGLFDSHALFQDMFDYPARYLNGTALLNVTGCIHSCPALADGTRLPCTTVGGSDRDSYLWYDELHPSEQANRVVAREFTDAILRKNERWTTWFS